MLDVASKILICLLLAAILGLIIGYLLGKCNGELQARRDGAWIPSQPPAPRKTKRVVQEDTSLESRRPERDHLEVVEELDESMIDEPNDDIYGEQPMYLTRPRDGEGDKLTRIRGIGVKIDEALKDVGIFHFDQIANWSEANIDWIENNVAFPGRVKREQWVAQARILASGKSTGFSKRVDNGEVASSIKK